MLVEGVTEWVDPWSAHGLVSAMQSHTSRRASGFGTLWGSSVAISLEFFFDSG